MHASYSNQALVLTQAVKGVNAGKTQSSTRGAWLKAATTARLRIHTSDELQPCVLSLHIQDDVLLQKPLSDSSIKLALLPYPQQHTSILLLMAVQQVGREQMHGACFCSNVQLQYNAGTTQGSQWQGRRAAAAEGQGHRRALMS